MIRVLSGWQVFICFVTEQYQPDSIIIEDGGITKISTDPGYHLPFTLGCAKKGAWAYINQEIDRKLSFFFKQFSKIVSHSCCYIPVYKSHIISRYVFSHFFKS